MVNGKETSLKQVIQKLQSGESVKMLQGTVTQIDPIKIQIVNDAKLILNERILIIPQHLTDYTVSVDIDTSEQASDENESDSTSELTGTSMTVNNSLKVGENVHILALNKGKLYYVLDRVVS